MSALRLLIIDDSDDDAVLIADRLRRDGISVAYRRVDTAEATAAALGEEPPDLVISDYNIPGYSAEAALAQIAAAGLDVPFILVSGQVGEESAARLMRAGAHDFLLKDRLTRLVPVVQRELQEAEDRRERRHAQAALAASEERFRLLAEHTADIIFSYRLVPEPHLEYISPAATAVIGRSPGELLADPELVFAAVEDGAQLKASWHCPDPEPLTVRWHRPDGTAVWTEQRAVGIVDAAGRLVAVEGILRDVTDRTIAEQRRSQLEQQLRQTERLEAIGQLAGGVAHDFNNLLAGISGYAELIAPELPPDSQLRKDLDGIIRAAERGAALVRQLMIFSRLQPSRSRVIDLNTHLPQIYELLHRTVGDHIDLRILADAPQALVSIDPSKLDQIIVNLAVNARDAMPHGGRLTIRTASLGGPEQVPACAAEPPHRHHVRVTVTDTGSGMSPEVAARAFDPFFTTKEVGRGTGLGLATVYGIVQDADGHIALTSVPGEGTTFDIDLPAEAVPAAAAVPAPADEGDHPAGRGQTILVAEDQDGVRETVTRILTRADYVVRAAATPTQALVLAADDPPIDLVLTDAVMPEMSGIDLIREIRRSRPGLPAILMSGYTANSLPSGRLPPADIPLLNKPFTASAVLQAIRRLLDTPDRPAWS